MSKLVLFLPDGTTLDIPLARERTTIGRRADNDICMPHLAVSGEHAVVVTILADSFLEDLQSTNGTLVNDKPVEGISPPSLNGQPVGSDGTVLAPGDIIEVAGTRVEYLDPGAQAAKRDVTA